MMWWHKKKRAMHADDFETWEERGVSPTLNAFDNTDVRAITVVDNGDGPRRLTPLERERLQGFPNHWTAGVAYSARCAQMGNAVTVPVAEWIARRLNDTDAAEAVGPPSETASNREKEHQT